MAGITIMTFETFHAILADEGITDEGINLLWNDRPQDIELEEAGLRHCAKFVKGKFPQYFFMESLDEASRYIPPA